MKKILKFYGDSLVVVFDKEEREVYDLADGDVIDIVIMDIERGGKKKSH